MMNTAAYLYIALALTAITLLVLYFRTGHLLRCIFFTMTSGFLALGIVWLLAKFTDIALAVTPFTVTVSAILGIPGVISMLIFHLL